MNDYNEIMWEGQEVYPGVESWDARLRQVGREVVIRLKQVLKVKDAEAQKREHEIVRSVLASGLKSSIKMKREGHGVFELSGDQKPLDMLYGGKWTPGEMTLDHSLYSQDLDSVIRVMMERGKIGMERDERRRLTGYARAAAKSNFLVVCKEEDLTQPYWDRDEVKPDKFAAVLFPEDMFRRIQGDIPAELRPICHSVGDKVITMPVKEAMREPVMNRLTVPDYSRAIQKLFGDKRETVWFTGVRTPILLPKE